MSISLPPSAIRKAYLLVRSAVVALLILVLVLLASCATDDAPTLCTGSASHPRADDPYVRMLVREGLSLRDAQVKASINRTNGCP